MSENLAECKDGKENSAVAFLEYALGNFPVSFSVKLWDGREWSPTRSTGTRRFSLVLNSPASLWRMFVPGNELTLGEGYIYGDFDIEGDLEEAFALGDFIMSSGGTLRSRIPLAWRLLRLPKRRGSVVSAPVRGTLHSRERDRQAVSHHYNVGNDFYSLWLDRNMVYSCAYFRHPAESLDVAQERKLDYICRKLRLLPGETLLDIGCGWGALVMHAVRHYGVRALGVTLSSAQAEEARRRIEAAGLGENCSVEIRDYRDVDGTFDKIVSVGMFEHVGRTRLAEYFSHAWRLLRPQGLFLNHGIAESKLLPKERGPSFIEKYVFPDSDLVPVSDTLSAAESAGFEVRDVESLREHYALTLRHWGTRLQERYEDAVRVTDEVTCRIWRLYMAGSAYGFRVGRLNVYQSLLARPEQGSVGLPLTREHLYPEGSGTGSATVH